MFLALFSSIFFSRFSLGKWPIESCRFKTFFRLCLWKYFLTYATLEVFLVACHFESFFDVCRFENSFVARVYLVALKMIFRRLVLVWKCFLALFSLKMFCRWSLGEWCFDACRYENILLVFVVLKMSLVLVAMKMNFWLLSLPRCFLESLSLKIDFWWMSLWIFLRSCLSKWFFGARCLEILALVALKNVFWRLD